MNSVNNFHWDLVSNEKRVHKEDVPLLESWYKTDKNTLKLQTHLFPEPYIGNPINASLILLALNPGYAGTEEAWYKKHNGKVEKILMDNLLHKVKEKPYYYFNEDIRESSPGHDYILKRFKALLGSTKEVTQDDLSSRMAMIQFFPYHSARFKYMPNKYLPSQKYNFSLVLQAMKNNKTFICMRSFNKWEQGLNDYINGSDQILEETNGWLGGKGQFGANGRKGVLTLYKEKYNKLFELRNPRSTYVTLNNLKGGQGDYDTIIQAIKGLN